MGDNIVEAGLSRAPLAHGVGGYETGSRAWPHLLGGAPEPVDREILDAAVECLLEPLDALVSEDLAEVL